MGISNWPFTLFDCTGSSSGDEEFYQTAMDYMSNNGADPYAFSCDYAAGYSSYVDATSIESCSSAALCIGSHGKQHACSIFNRCFLVDWTSGISASPCNSTLLDYLNIQSPGMNTPCCGSDFCTKPEQQFGLVNQCTNTQHQELWLCVNDGSSAECLRTRDNATCSGNLTNPIQSSLSTPTSSSQSTQTIVSGSTTSTKSANTSASSGWTWKIAASATLAGTAILVVLVIIWLKRRRPDDAQLEFLLEEGGSTENQGDPFASGEIMPYPTLFPGPQVQPVVPAPTPSGLTVSGSHMIAGGDITLSHNNGPQNHSVTIYIQHHSPSPLVQ